MGNCTSHHSKVIIDAQKIDSCSEEIDQSSNRTLPESHKSNLHTVLDDIKIHSVVSSRLDHDHASSMRIPLGEVNDEQLLAEVARRKLDLHSKINDKVVKQSYAIGRVLGQGASGAVFEVTNKESEKKYACKVVKRNKDMNDMQSMSTEIEIMKRISHRNIVTMHELYESPKCLWIILELVNGGDLNQYLCNCNEYTEAVAARKMHQALKAVHYLHSMGIVHRDLKLDNFLLSSDQANADLKIADFGLSALLRLGENGYHVNDSNKRKTFTGLHDMWGTKEYFAPEVVTGEYGPQADLWALGCVLFELLTGEQAFPVKENDDEMSFYDRILEGGVDMSSSVWMKVSPAVKDLLFKMLLVDPELRWSANECLNHKWILEGTSHATDLSEVGISMRKRAEERRGRSDG